MTEEMPAEDLVRTQDFPTDGPVELDLGLGSGRVDIELADGATDVHVELRHDPESGSAWTQGITSTLSWLTEQFGEDIGADLSASASAAVSQTRIEMVGTRLVVRAPKPLPLRHVPLSLKVRAPSGSQLDVKASSARVASTGSAGRVDVSTTSGDVALDRAEGAVTVRTGGGGVSVGPVPSGLHVRSGGGEVRAAAVAGSASVVTGTGSVRIGSVDGNLTVRSGSGDLSVADAGDGNVNLKTGSGAVRVGVRSGVLAEVDLSSATGTVSTELEVSDTEPDERVPLVIRARTGSGNAVVTGSTR